MQLQLTVTAGPDSGEVFEIGTGDLTLIGRGPGSAVRLSDPRISRTHCRIHVDGGKVSLSDADSRWGTLVNGEPIQKQRLLPGDVIKLGETELTFDVLSDASATTLAPRPKSRVLAEAAGEDKTAGQTPAARPSRVEPKPNAQSSDEPPDVQPPPPAEAFDQTQQGDSTEQSPTEQPPPEEDSAPSPRREKPPAKQNRPAKAAGKLVGQRAALNKLVGTELHGYEILEQIARGRSGRLFRANDTERNRTVALKVLRPELIQQEGELQRFQRAIKTIRGIRHENLVSLYAAGCSRGLCWIAMEYIDGPSAADLIQKIGIAGMIDWTQALRIATHIAQALESIYDEEIIHRNISPATILLQTADRKAKLGGLLLAKALDGAQSDRITVAGELIGKMAYLPPEQINNPLNVDHRADMYSLGATVYALLTGRSPCEGNTPTEVLQNIQARRPKPPTDAQLAIPAMFEGIVLRMLNKRPEDRYETPTILVKELRRVAKFRNVEID